MLEAPVLLGEAAVHHALNSFPQIDRNQRLVTALDHLAVPLAPVPGKTDANQALRG
ncbi:MAG: hypothetical protein SGJ07_13940 [Rhodospirillaceae bacterium]|nr:hypothetical protein [Rhodospirillaceae bacterium]